MSTNCDIIVIFPIYGQFGVTQKPDSGHIVCKTYFSSKVTFYTTKTDSRTKKSNIDLSKGTAFAKNTDFLQEGADIRKIKRALVLKGLFSETAYVCTYKFQVSSII